MSRPNSSHALYTVEQVRGLDRRAIDALAITGLELMQRAADAAFDRLREHWPTARRLLVLAGPGNNGGDAFLLAVRALDAGFEVALVALDGAAHGDAAAARARFVATGASVGALDDHVQFDDVDVVVDGLFGSGLARAIEGAAARAIDRLNAAGLPTIALDVPSGINADTGLATGPALRADLTACFVAWKRGLFTGDAVDACGILHLETLAIPESVHEGVVRDVGLLDLVDIARLPPRRRNVNKGSFGRVLAIGGDDGMAGAVRLAAEASLRVGAGLVSVATRAAHLGALNATRPELIVRAVDGPQSIAPMLQAATALALGPGLGQGAWGHALWDSAVRAGKPLVIDADGLNLLARFPCALPHATILTPHPGEAARLLGTDVASIQRDRFAAVRAIAARHQCVVVLKGAGSLVAGADGRVALCPFGNPGMASAGMGDVLSGVVAGLLAQGLDGWDAACVGVVAHAVAGDRAAGASPRGLVAGDLMLPLREIVNGHFA